jgi:hypothetical protein
MMKKGRDENAKAKIRWKKYMKSPRFKLEKMAWGLPISAGPVKEFRISRVQELVL